MNHTGGKYTEAQAAAIMAEAHANLRQHDEDMRQRDGVGKIVHKTIDNARVDDAPVARADSEMSWWQWTDARIAAAIERQADFDSEGLRQGIDKIHDAVQAALDKRDREIENLRREIKMLRDEVGLERGLAKLKAEVDRARQQAPSFKSELNGLQEKVAKQEKLITRLRGEASQLAYRQQQLDSQQQKDRREVTLTAVQLTAIGGQTRSVLETLRANGVDFIEEWAPSGLAS